MRIYHDDTAYPNSSKKHGKVPQNAYSIVFLHIVSFVLALALVAGCSGKAVPLKAKPYKSKPEEIKIGFSPTWLGLNKKTDDIFILNSQINQIVLKNRKNNNQTYAFQLDEGLSGIAYAESANTIFACSKNSNMLYSIDIARKKLNPILKMQKSAKKLLVDSKGSIIFALSENANTVIAINPPSKTYIGEVKLGSSISDIAYSAKNKTLYLTMPKENKIAAVRLNNGSFGKPAFEEIENPAIVRADDVNSKVYVTCKKNGIITILNGISLKREKKIDTGRKIDQLIVDETRYRLIASENKQSIATIVDLKAGKAVEAFAVDINGYAQYDSTNRDLWVPDSHGSVLIYKF
ncbi:MAG: hypothetical protein K6T91_03875 [Firmicutes bacterium]|nr:hypothetical protein [Bacillota bacterium]